MEGILNINKPPGLSSHAVVAAVRRLIPGEKAGHTGTLDPLAGGVLPVCLGKATRIAEYVIDLPKGYRAAVELGTTTDTEDAAGKVLAEQPVPLLNRASLEEIFRSLTGTREQLPPVYSAVKYRGKPLYYWTRRGRDVVRRARRITIYRLELLQYNQAGQPHLLFDVVCSRGTYIRTLAAEIGSRIGCGAYLFSLERRFVGPFSLAEACTLEQLRDAAGEGKLGRFLQPMDRPLQHLPALSIDDQAVLALKQGKTLTAAALGLEGSAVLPGDSLLRIYDSRGIFKALARWESTAAADILRTVKYLATDEG
ncbi:MAG: tRNA pseudouridine(55) synthase TruB [Bacillota bacterium]